MTAPQTPETGRRDEPGYLSAGLGSRTRSVSGPPAPRGPSFQPRGAAHTLTVLHPDLGRVQVVEVLGYTLAAPVQLGYRRLAQVALASGAVGYAPLSDLSIEVRP